MHTHSRGGASLLVAATLLVSVGAGCSSTTKPAASASGSTPTTLTVVGANASAGGSTSAPTPASGSPAATSTSHLSSSGGDATACSIVTEAEATTPLGSPAGPGVLKGKGKGWSSRCTFGDSALMVFLAPDAKSVFDQGHAALAAAPAGTWSDLTGLGDAAYVAQGGPVATLAILKGTTMVSITLSGSSAADPKAAVVALGRSAVARI